MNLMYRISKDITFWGLTIVADVIHLIFQCSFIFSVFLPCCLPISTVAHDPTWYLSELSQSKQVNLNHNLKLIYTYIYTHLYDLSPADFSELASVWLYWISIWALYPISSFVAVVWVWQNGVFSGCQTLHNVHWKWYITWQIPEYTPSLKIHSESTLSVCCNVETSLCHPLKSYLLQGYNEHTFLLYSHRANQLSQSPGKETFPLGAHFFSTSAASTT